MIIIDITAIRFQIKFTSLLIHDLFAINDDDTLLQD